MSAKGPDGSTKHGWSDQSKASPRPGWMSRKGVRCACNLLIASPLPAWFRKEHLSAKRLVQQSVSYRALQLVSAWMVQHAGPTPMHKDWVPCSAQKVSTAIKTSGAVGLTCTP